MTKDHPILRFTNEAMASLRELAQTNPSLWKDQATDFVAMLKDLGINSPTEQTALMAALPIQMPSPEEGSKRQQVDRHSLALLENIEGMTPAHMADPNLLAWMSCVPLLAFGINRWPPAINHDPVKWIHQHFLAQNGQDITSASVAGRCLWLPWTAKRAASQIPTLSDRKIVEHFSIHPEQYHQCVRFQVMRSATTMSEYVLTLMTDADGVKTSGAYEIARDLNRAAGARLLDSLDKSIVRKISTESARRVMSNPEHVLDRSKLRNSKSLKVLSLGAGVQSTAMALMAEQGYAGLEKPDIAIFADTQWEPPQVYEHLEWLKTQLSFEIITVTAGNLGEDVLAGRTFHKQNFIPIPVFTLDPNGKPGVAKRQCTADYKVAPINQEIRRLLGIPKGRPARIEQMAEVWIGITTDEATRQKQSKQGYIKNTYPLIERGYSRNQVNQWFRERFPERTLPRSACIACPYKTDVEWKHMRDTDPESFEHAKFVDMALRESPQLKDHSKVQMFISKHRTPLYQVDLDNPPSQEDLFQQECEGMCRV